LGDEVNKIEVDYSTFYVCAMSITVIAWLIIGYYTEASIFALFFPTWILSYILVRICARYFFEIK
jgi:hypothetical protein